MSPVKRASAVNGLRQATAPAPSPAAAAPRPPAAYSARISHTTTPAQLEALEELRTAEKATGDGAVSVTALLRAATAICLSDAKLRARLVRSARGEWR